MKGLRCEFYADEGDLKNLLIDLNGLGGLRFVQSRSAVDKPNEVHTNALAMLKEAVVSPQKPRRRHSFLIIPSNGQVWPREIALADGSGTLTLVDQSTNLNSVSVGLGGSAGDNTLIMSDINTLGDTEVARELHKEIKKVVRKHSQRFGPRGSPCYLMSGAVEKAKRGWRLTRGKGMAASQDAKFAPGELC